MDDSSLAKKDFCLKSPFAHLYKRKGIDWKTEVRRNVSRRLRNGRNNLIDRFRSLNVEETKNILDQVIQEELRKQYNEELSAEELDEAIQEYEELRQELFQEELDYVLSAENDLILTEIAYYFDSDDVYCPLCQKCALSFPDQFSFFCERCGYNVRLTKQMPSATELRRYFENVFTNHSESGCPNQIKVSMQNDNMTFHCLQCNLFVKLF